MSPKCVTTSLQGLHLHNIEPKQHGYIRGNELFATCGQPGLELQT